MANRGNFSTSGYQGRHLVFSWQITEVNISNNTTTISWEVKGAGNASSSWYQSGNFKFMIDNEIVYQSTQTIRLYIGTTVAAGKKTISHNNDGSRTFSASVSAGIYNYGSTNATGSDSWALDNIPRQATLTAAPNFTDEENPTITYSNPAGDAITKLEACITKADESRLITYRPLLKNGNSYTFELKPEEREALYAYCNDSNSKTVKFFVASEIGGARYYSELSRTVSIVNALPTMNPTVWDTNETTLKLTGDNTKFIRYRSNGNFNFNAQAHKGASIVSYRVANGGVVKTGQATGVIDFVQASDFAFAIEDSRGNTITKVIQTNCYPYIVPSISFSKITLAANGDLSVFASGIIYKGSFGAGDNLNKCYIRYKEQGGEYSEYKSANSIDIGKNGQYSANFTINGLDYSKTYVVQAAVEDSFVFITTDERVVVSTPLFDWGKEDFRFNTPIVSGAVYGIGGVPDRNFIWSGDNLNDYTIPDTYAIAATNEAAGVENIPIQSAGKLIVSASLGYSTNKEYFSYIRQEFIPHTTDYPIFHRHATKNNIGVWIFSAWQSEMTVADSGKSGQWEYIKYTNGFAMANCSYPINLLCNQDWNGLWVSNEVGGIVYPFTFILPPAEVATIVSSDSVNCWAVSYQAATANKSGLYLPTRSSRIDWNAAGYLNIIALGRWK